MPKRLTKGYVTAITQLLHREDDTIWEVGDYLVAHPLNENEMEELAVKVDRSITTLRGRFRMSSVFAANEWDRTRATWGVFAELYRLSDEPAMRRLLESRKQWTRPQMRMAVNKLIDERLERDEAQSRVQQLRKSCRAFHLTSGETELVGQAELQEGMLHIRLASASIPDGKRIRVTWDNVGNMVVKIPLDVEIEDEQIAM